MTCTPSEVTKTISTGVPGGKDALVIQVKVTVAELLGGIEVIVIVVVVLVVVPPLLLLVVVVVMAVVRGVEHIRVPFVNSSSAVAMETVGLAGGL